MKYKTFEDLYNDNRELIEYEFKNRFFTMLDMILAKIDWYQEQEHKEIDGGNPGSLNDIYRKNIRNLEKIYQPLYNYVHDIPDKMLDDERFPMVMSAKHKFIEAALPSEDEIIREYRGKPGWQTKLYQLTQKQNRLADILEGVLVWSYKLGCKDISKEPKDVYTEEEKFREEEHMQSRRQRLSHLQSYAQDTSFARIVASLYGMGYNDALAEKPGDFNNAAENGLKTVQGFWDNITKEE